MGFDFGLSVCGSFGDLVVGCCVCVVIRQNFVGLLVLGFACLGRGLEFWCLLFLFYFVYLVVC